MGDANNGLLLDKFAGIFHAFEHVAIKRCADVFLSEARLHAGEFVVANFFQILRLPQPHQG